MQTDHPENQWIKDYQKGDVAALGCLVEHFRRPLFAFIHNMLQGRGDAEEIFQEVWLRAIKNMDRYRDRNFCGWLFRIAHNLFIDQVRRERHQAIWPRQNPDQGEPPMIEKFPDHRHTPDQLAADADLGLRIRMALAGLPGEQREVFLMRSEADLSFKQIADIQGTTLNTALSRMHYAVQKLRPLLVEDYQQLTGGSSHEHPARTS